MKIPKLIYKNLSGTAYPLYNRFTPSKEDEEWFSQNIDKDYQVSFPEKEKFTCEEYFPGVIDFIPDVAIISAKKRIISELTIKAYELFPDDFYRIIVSEKPEMDEVSGFYVLTGSLYVVGIFGEMIKKAQSDE